MNLITLAVTTAATEVEAVEVTTVVLVVICPLVVEVPATHFTL